MEKDKDYMQLAINLASATQGQTSPNPVVGAVLVKDHQVVGIGAHLKAGEPHAEIHALHMAGEKSKGATMYVTLEPCAHYGRTPPCAEGLIKAGISRVVVASIDPNDQVSGQGLVMLKDAGIRVTQGVLQKEAMELNEPFFYSIKEKKPFVTLKTGASLDGKIATFTGESKWITGEESRQDAHVLRHRHDAILVGVNTIISDNPTLNTRLQFGGKNPIRIILDHQLRTPMDAKVLNDKISPVWIVTSSNHNVQLRKELERAGIKVIVMKEPSIQIESLLDQLYVEGITSILVEGGGSVNDSFIRSGFFNQIVFYFAPMIIGGKNAPSCFSGIGFEKLIDAPRLSIKSVETLGDDIRVVAVKRL